MTRKRLGEILIAEGLITNEHLQDALQIQRFEPKMLGEILVEKSFVTEADIAKTLTVQFQVPYLSPQNYDITEEILDLLPREMYYQYLFIPVDRFHNILTIIMAGLLPREVIEDIQTRTGCELAIYIGTATEVRERLYELIPPSESTDMLAMRAPQATQEQANEQAAQPPAQGSQSDSQFWQQPQQPAPQQQQPAAQQQPAPQQQQPAAQQQPAPQQQQPAAPQQQPAPQQQQPAPQPQQPGPPQQQPVQSGTGYWSREQLMQPPPGVEPQQPLIAPGQQPPPQQQMQPGTQSWPPEQAQQPAAQPGTSSQPINPDQASWLLQQQSQPQQPYPPGQQPPQQQAQPGTQFYQQGQPYPQQQPPVQGAPNFPPNAQMPSPTNPPIGPNAMDSAEIPIQTFEMPAMNVEDDGDWSKLFDDAEAEIKQEKKNENPPPK